MLFTPGLPADSHRIELCIEVGSHIKPFKRRAVGDCEVAVVEWHLPQLIPHVRLQVSHNLLALGWIECSRSLFNERLKRLIAKVPRKRIGIHKGVAEGVAIAAPA